MTGPEVTERHEAFEPEPDVATGSHPQSTPARRSGRRRVLANFGWMQSGNWVSNALSALTLATVPRLLGPQQYGVMASALAIVGLFGALRLTGYDKVLIRDSAADLAKAGRNYAKVRLLKRWGSAAAVLLSLAVALSTASTRPELPAVIILVWLNVTQAYSSLNMAVLQAFERMHLLPIVNFARQCTYLALAVPLLLLVPSARSAAPVCALLLLSYVVATILSGVFRRRLVPSTPRVRLKDLDRPFLVSGLMFSSSALFVYLYTRIDVLLIGMFLRSVDVGHYNLALSVVDKASGPFSVMVTAMFPALVRRHAARGTSLREVAMMMGAFLGVAAVIAAGVWLIAPYVVLTLAGSAFSSSVEPLRALVLALPFNIMLYPLIQVMQAMRREDIPVKLAPVRAVLNVGLDLLVLRAGLGITAVAWGTVATNAIFAAVFSLVALRLVVRDHRGRSAPA